MPKKPTPATPWSRYPYPALPVWVIAEHSYCEQRVDLWLNNPGERISVPRELEGSPASLAIESAADSGRASHAALAAEAQPIPAEALPALQQSGAAFILLESLFEGKFRRLPIVGAPDAVICQNHSALLIIDYKFTSQEQLTMSHRVQLQVYGYLLEQKRIL